MSATIRVYAALAGENNGQALPLPWGSMTEPMGSATINGNPVGVVGYQVQPGGLQTIYQWSPSNPVQLIGIQADGSYVLGMQSDIPNMNGTASGTGVDNQNFTPSNLSPFFINTRQAVSAVNASNSALHTGTLLGGGTIPGTWNFNAQVYLVQVYVPSAAPAAVNFRVATAN